MNKWIRSLILGIGLMMAKESVAMDDAIKTFDLSTLRPKASVYDIALGSNDTVLVPDLSHNQVIILNQSLDRAIKILKVPSPHAAIEDSRGFFYVGTHRSGHIRKFDKDFREVLDWDHAITESGELKAPVALEFGSDNTLYVCDWILQRVIHVNDQGQLLKVFDDKVIKARAQFQAHGLAVDFKRQRVYVADRGNDGGNGEIHSFSFDGQYQKSWPKPAADFDPFTIRALTEDLFIVPNYSDGAVYIFDHEGNMLEKIEVLGSDVGKFEYATSVVTDTKGFIYVSELKGNRIQRVNFNPVIERLRKKLQN